MGSAPAPGAVGRALAANCEAWLGTREAGRLQVTAIRVERAASPFGGQLARR